VDALAQIARNEGIAGLYKGLGPSVFLVSHGALQFAAYERLRAWRTKPETTFTTTTEQNGPATVPPSAFECAWLGVASKLFASTVTYPSQVVRARMQQERRSVGVRLDGKQNAGQGSAPNAPLYRGFFSSLRDIIRREGASGLYKGMVPNVLRTLPSSGVTFMVYESVRSFLGEDDEARRR
jgi:solute carrier family 25 folate transporter 32